MTARTGHNMKLVLRLGIAFLLAVVSTAWAEEFDSAGEIRAIKTPFLVIVGENDPVRQRFVEPLQQLRPDVPVKVVTGAGHLGCVSKSDFMADLKAFLDH